MGEILEDLLAELNRNIFFREFSFSENQFTPAPGEEMEFADHVVWIDDLMMIYQVKQRESAARSEDEERKWFNKKVLGLATRQVRDTLRYLRENENIEIRNQRGHTLPVKRDAVKRIVRLVVYQRGKALPADCSQVKHYVSRTAGFMHVLPWIDYLRICQTLITPAEVDEYLTFRERVIGTWGTELPSEPALVGQFLSGQDDKPPSEAYVRFLEALKSDYEQFDISYLLDGICDRIEHWEGPGDVLDYYKIIAQFAKLNRLELSEIKKRVLLCLDAAKGGRFMATRIIGRTGCGFALVAAFSETGRKTLDERMRALKYYAGLAKYEQRLQKQVGVSFSKDGKDYLIDWLLIESDWQYDGVVEDWLRDDNPFPSLRFEVRERYRAKGEEPQP